MKQILNRLFDHESLTREEASAVMKNIAAGTYSDAQIAAFISVYLMRSIELEEVIGFRNALLELAVPMDLSEFDALDIVGTGGDGKNTFNISSLTAMILFIYPFSTSGQIEKAVLPISKTSIPLPAVPKYSFSFKRVRQEK